MHITIPEYSNLKDQSQSTYIAYHVHLNGLFHSRLRFKQLHSLHEELRKRFSRNVLPFFPRKKLFNLDVFEIEQRRYQLEHYLQQLCQDEQIVSNHHFISFFLSAQQNTLNVQNEPIQLQVWLENETSTKVSILSTDSLQTVKQKIGSHLQITSSLIDMFSLFMVRMPEDSRSTKITDSALIVREVSDLESPHISILIGRKSTDTYTLLWRRFYWNKETDLLLLQNEMTTRLLCASINRFVDQNRSKISKDHQRQLETFQVWKDKRDYVKFSQEIRFYGYWKFSDCVANYPSDQIKVDVWLGERDLVFHSIGSNASEEFTFSLNRIRCWRLTTLFKNNHDLQLPGKSRFVTSAFDFAFEYLQPSGKLKWINIKSDQVIVIALCLQKIVQDLLKKQKTESKDQGKKEIHVDFTKRICNYWKKGSTNRIGDQLQLTKSQSVDTFHRPKTSLAETSFSSENKMFGGMIKEDQL